MYLNLYGQIAAEEWRKTVAVRKNISLGAFVVMPDHLHGIISIDYQVTPQNNAPASFRSPTQTIGAMVRGYKGATTKRIKNIAINYSKHGMNIPSNITIDPKKTIWQRDYYDVIISNEQMHKNITNYIRHNPEKWEENLSS